MKLPRFTPFASIKAAVAAAKRIANRTRRPVKVIISPAAIRRTMPTVPIPRQSMRDMVYTRKAAANPKRRRRNPWAVHTGQPSWHQAGAGHASSGAMIYKTKREAEAYMARFKSHHPHEPAFISKYKPAAGAKRRKRNPPEMVITQTMHPTPRGHGSQKKGEGAPGASSTTQTITQTSTPTSGNKTSTSTEGGPTTTTGAARGTKRNPSYKAARGYTIHTVRSVHHTGYDGRIVADGIGMVASENGYPTEAKALAAAKRELRKIVRPRRNPSWLDAGQPKKMPDTGHWVTKFTDGRGHVGAEMFERSNEATRLLVRNPKRRRADESAGAYAALRGEKKKRRHVSKYRPPARVRAAKRKTTRKRRR